MNDGDADMTVCVSTRRAGARIRFVLSARTAELVGAAFIATYLNTVVPFYVVEFPLLVFQIHNALSLYYDFQIKNIPLFLLYEISTKFSTVLRCDFHFPRKKSRRTRRDGKLLLYLPFRCFATKALQSASTVSSFVFIPLFSASRLFRRVYRKTNKRFSTIVRLK